MNVSRDILKHFFHVTLLFILVTCQRCVDEDPLCGPWAAAGHCQPNSWARDHCQISCSSCSSPTNVVISAAQPPVILSRRLEPAAPPVIERPLIQAITQPPSTPAPPFFGFANTGYNPTLLPRDLAPLGFLLGIWREDLRGKARFPTIPVFTYGEQLDFSIAEQTFAGGNILNYTAHAWGLNTQEELHSENGFLTAKNGKISLNTVMSNGFTAIEEGHVERDRLLLHSVDVERISFSRDLPVTNVPSTSGVTDEELNDLMHYLENNPLTEQRKSALRGFLTSYRLKYVNQQVDPIFFTDNLVGAIEKLIANEPHRGIKLWICLQIQFEKATDPSEIIYGFFCCKQKIILPGTDRIEMIESAFPEILLAIDAFESKGSGWVIKQILHADEHFSKYQPLRGCSYKQLPKYLHDKHAIVNPQNSDNRCFMWAILAALHPLPIHGERVSNYSQYTDELSFCGINFPVSISQVKKIERQNDLSINVYGFEDKDVYPLYISKSTDQHIDLLFYDAHYSWIKNLDSLLYDQRKHRSKKYFCLRCLIPMYSEAARSDHLTRCGGDPTRIKMPEETELKFINIHRMQWQPLLVYADFECLTEPITAGHGNTHKYQHHTPCSCGLVESLSCCKQPTFSEPVIYRGDNPVWKFLLELIQIAIAHQERLNQFSTLRMTSEDKERHKSFTCHICEKQIQPNEKVRDHCHICGTYRGPAHNECNQAFRLNRDVVVVFHNLRRYDGHLIMQHLGQICKDVELEIQCVAKGLEDYIGFSIKSRPDKDRGESTGGQNNDGEPAEDGNKEYPWKIKFIDSFQFLTSSLEGLVNNLDKQKFKAMGTQFDVDELKLLLRKGVFCYEWLNKWEKFDYPLPMKTQFYSKLNDSNISDEDYSHAKKVWNAFEMTTMGEYHDLYLKTDVLLLADVFESFRSFCLENYKLDPAHYLTLPAFGWDACLKMTNITL